MFNKWGNSYQTLAWHFAISARQQGAQAEQAKHSSRKSDQDGSAEV